MSPFFLALLQDGEVYRIAGGAELLASRPLTIALICGAASLDSLVAECLIDL